MKSYRVFEQSGKMVESGVVGDDSGAATAQSVAAQKGYSVEANGLLEGRFLVWVRDADTREVWLYPQPLSFDSLPSALQASRTAAQEGRLLEALLTAESAVALAPHDFPARQWHRDVLVRLGFEEWKELILDSARRCVELAPASSKASQQAVLDKESGRARFSAPDAGLESIMELARVGRGIDRPEDEFVGLAYQVAYGWPLMVDSQEELLRRLNAIDKKENARSVLRVWLDFQFKQPSGLGIEERRWLEERREKAEPLIESVLDEQEDNPVWREALQELQDAKRYRSVPRRPLTPRERKLQYAGHLVFALLTSLALLTLPRLQTLDANQLVAQARSAMSAGEVEAADRLASRILYHGVRGHREPYIEACQIAFASRLKRYDREGAIKAIAGLQDLDSKLYEACLEKLRKSQKKTGKKTS